MFGFKQNVLKRREDVIKICALLFVLKEQRSMEKLQNSTDQWCDFITHSKSGTDFPVNKAGSALQQSSYQVDFSSFLPYCNCD